VIAVELLRMTDVRLRFSAAHNGWRRVGAPFFEGGRGPLLLWTGPGGRPHVTGDPSVLPEPLRQAARALVIGYFEGSCPLCGGGGRSLSVDEAVESWATAQVITLHEVRTSLGADGVLVEAVPPDLDRPVFAIVHEASCAASPASIERCAAAGSN
jgi:hypothetical protein